MNLEIPKIFLGDSPVVGGDFSEPFNLQPLNRDGQGSGDMSGGRTGRDNRDLPVIDLRTDPPQNEDPTFDVQERTMAFDRTGNVFTLQTEDDTLVRFTDNSNPHDPSTAQHGGILIETPFFSGPDGTGGVRFGLEQTPSQAFMAYTDESRDVPVIAGGHGLERLAAGVFGMVDRELGEDMRLRIAGGAGVVDQRPLESNEAAQLVYRQTVSTLEAMIQAEMGDVVVGGGLSQEGNTTVHDVYAGLLAGDINLRLEGQWNENGEFSPRLVFTTATDGRDLVHDDVNSFHGPRLPSNALEIYVERNPEDGGVNIGGNIRIDL